MKSEEDEDEKVAASALNEVSYCLKTEWSFFSSFNYFLYIYLDVKAINKALCAQRVLWCHMV